MLSMIKVVQVLLYLVVERQVDPVGVKYGGSVAVIVGFVRFIETEFTLAPLLGFELINSYTFQTSVLFSLI